MVTIRPFRALRPAAAYAEQIAALPYDVYSRAEAREQVQDRALSFLNIDRPETQFPADFDMYSAPVYEKADELLQKLEREGYLRQDAQSCYYVYELIMEGRSQTGLAACSAVDDYLNGVIKKHENTRADKERDRIRHVDKTSAQTGPIFLTYRGRPAIKEILTRVKQAPPLYDFVAADGITHRLWQISDPAVIARLTGEFAQIEATYIADGHHRAASAVKVSQMRRQEHPDHTGEEEFNYFLSVLFDKDELKIFDYNRVVKDRNGRSDAEIREMIRQSCEVVYDSEQPIRPECKGEFGFCFQGKWYLLKERPEKRRTDPVEGMDVSYLQREVLGPVFGIEDPSSDKRIGFVGGIRGLNELAERVRQDCVCACAMYPTSIDELFAVADAGLLMPPKSTWFEPKLRSGLLIHKIER